MRLVHRGVFWPVAGLLGGAVFCGSLAAQPPRLDGDGDAQSFAASVRGEAAAALIDSLVGPARETLLTRLRAADQRLADQLGSLPDDPSTTATRSRLSLARVDLATLAAELLAEQPDRVAPAAAEAIDRASQAIAVLPADGPIAQAVWRQVVAMHRLTGDRQSARRVFEQAARRFDLPIDPPTQPDEPDEPDEPTQPGGEPLDAAWVTLAIHLALDRGDRAEADRWLQRLPAESSLNLELARLRWLSGGGETAAVADKIAAIRRRHGEPAGRRAETLLRRWTGNAAGDQQPIGTVIAAARSSLASGDRAGAIVRLATESLRRSDADESFRLATAAAALSQEDKPRAAASLLRSVVQRFAAHDLAPAAALQAIRLDARGGMAGESIDAALRSLGELWPTSPSAPEALAWRIELAVGRGDRLAAADLAGQIDRSRWTPADTDRCKRLWADALRPLIPSPQPWRDRESFARQRRQLSAAIESLLQRIAPQDREVSGELTRWCLSQFAELGALRRATPGGQSDGFAQLRLSPPGPLTSPPTLDADQRHRLIADGLADRQHVRWIGRLLLPTDLPPLSGVTVAVWTGDDAQAAGSIERAVAAGFDPADVYAVAAAASESTTRSVTTRPADFWAAAAAAATGEEHFHFATLRQCGAMVRAGDPAAAATVAKYTLLTRPPDQPTTADAYRAFWEPIAGSPK